MSIRQKSAFRRAFFDGSTLIMLVLVGGLIAYAVMSPYASLHVQRIWSMITGQDSNIGFLEEPIKSIHDEFMRRSPELQGIYDEYVQCAGQDVDLVSCSVEEIEERKTEIVRSQWPSIFDRLMAKEDWEPSVQRDSFFDALAEHTEDTLRTKCYPEIRFLRWHDTKVPDFYFERFYCT